MAKKYPWFQVVKNKKDLFQGDFINDCPIIMPPSEIPDTSDISVKVRTYDVVVMSQSCDLVANKIDLVLVCPYYSLEEVAKLNSTYSTVSGRELLKQGNVAGYHLLNKCNLKDFQKDFIVVDFKNVYAVPIKALRDMIKKSKQRLRLLPPYREHLSQAFARFFMRVGLPVDIPSFK